MPAEKYHRQIAAIDRDYAQVRKREGEQIFKMGPSYTNSQFEKRNNAAYKVLIAKRTDLRRKLGKGDIFKGDDLHQQWALKNGPRFLVKAGRVFELNQPRKSRKTRSFKARG
jgi:hypothetical protein|tara:strand:- start:9266 stop:9601 length:336 start_codon:yes stop_codon:yes gene_type:complete